MEEKDEKAAIKPVKDTRELPEDFWQSLLDLPACKRFGYCDDCGRCER